MRAMKASGHGSKCVIKQCKQFFIIYYHIIVLSVLYYSVSVIQTYLSQSNPSKQGF